MDLGNTHRLKVFVAVAEALSFSKAAERLLISQPSVSKRVRELEQIIGAPLFNRMGRTVALTEIGDLLLRHATEVTGLVGEMESEMDAAIHGVAGHLKLGMAGVWEYLLSPLLSGFRTAYPLIFIDLSTGHPRQIVDLVLESRVHLGLVGPAPTDSEIEGIPITEAELILITAPGDELAQGQLVNPSELAGPLSFVQELTGPLTSGIGLRYLEGLGIEAVSVMNLSTPEMIKRSVRTGAGFAMLSTSSVAEEVARGDLGQVRLDAPPCTFSLHAVRNRRRPVSPTQRAFLTYVTEALASRSQVPSRLRSSRSR